jgi:eukaryotic-like serine/threonine-protein kinase
VQSSIARLAVGVATAAATAGLLLVTTACEQAVQQTTESTQLPDTSRVPFPVPSWMATTPQPAPQPAPPAQNVATTTRSQPPTTRPRPRTTTRTPPRPTTTRPPVPTTTTTTTHA